MNCPINREHTASFYYNIETGLWHCFGCHVKGRGYLDLLVRLHIEGEQFVDLQDEYQEALRADDGEGVEEERRSVYDADVLFAQEMYGEPENWDVVSRERDYLYSRGFSRATLERYHVRVLDGVVKKTILIPLFYNGDVYGWQRRSCNEWEKPKYVTMPHLPKSQHLYGDLEPGKIVMVCEGVTDVWMAAQRGVTNVVATLGSFPSEAQWTLLQQARGIVCAYDPDHAGASGFKELTRLNAGEKFLARFNLSSDIATSTQQEYSAEIKRIKRLYKAWKEGASSTFCELAM